MFPASTRSHADLDKCSRPMNLLIPVPWKTSLVREFSRPNYNSTKVCFAYLGFSPGGAPDKTKACLLFYRPLQSRASRNCSAKSGSSCDFGITACEPKKHTWAGFAVIFFSIVGSDFKWRIFLEAQFRGQSSFAALSISASVSGVSPFFSFASGGW
jgi:hypothetical protein